MNFREVEKVGCTPIVTRRGTYKLRRQALPHRSVRIQACGAAHMSISQQCSFPVKEGRRRLEHRQPWFHNAPALRLMQPLGVLDCAAVVRIICSAQARARLQAPHVPHLATVRLLEVGDSTVANLTLRVARDRHGHQRVLLRIIVPVAQFLGVAVVVFVVVGVAPARDAPPHSFSSAPRITAFRRASVVVRKWWVMPALTRSGCSRCLSRPRSKVGHRWRGAITTYRPRWPRQICAGCACRMPRWAWQP